jgi:hypothetical protein
MKSGFNNFKGKIIYLDNGKHDQELSKFYIKNRKFIYYTQFFLV